MKLVAGRIGRVFNAHSLGNDLGVSNHTVKEWLSVLEASYIIIRLNPYYENLGKRVIKLPKIYFTDVGLATRLLDIHNVEQLNRNPLKGQLFENLVVMETFKASLNQGRKSELYFYRDNTGREIDLIYKTSHQLTPIEIKSSKTFNTSFLKQLDYFAELVGDRCTKGYLIYAEEPGKIHSN